MHLKEHSLVAYLDGELGDEERRTAARHLAHCDRCSGALDELRRASARLSDALGLIDLEPPASDPEAIRRRAGVLPLDARPADDARTSAGPAGQAAPSGRAGAAERPRRSLVAAAVLLLAFAGAAAAIPGSPLRAWLSESARAIAGLFDAQPVESPSVQEAVDAAMRLPSGVAVTPLGGSVRISLRSPSPDAVVRVRVVEDAQASVLAAEARYRTGAGRIEIVEAGPGEVRIDIPRSARSALIDVDGRPVVEKEGPDLRLLTPADTSGSEIFFRPGG